MYFATNLDVLKTEKSTGTGKAYVELNSKKNMTKSVVWKSNVTQMHQLWLTKILFQITQANLTKILTNSVRLRPEGDKKP